MKVWNFRPTALCQFNFEQLFRGDLVRYYNEDNSRASEEGVAVLPRPSTTTTTTTTTDVCSSWNTQIRTLQWNINSFSDDDTEGKDVCDAILDVNPDVLVLNEYHWDNCCTIHENFEQKLKQADYSSFHCGTVFAPTAIFTKLYVYKYKEIRLSGGRSALALQVDDEKNGDKLWIVGTHLDFQLGSLRQKQMEVLLDDELFHELDEVDENKHQPVILMGDLNQQRQKDYSPEEWERISKGMERRKTCQDDGVDNLLQIAGFQCAFDNNDHYLTATKRNWNTPFPPSTHWTGTIVDYSYSRNVQPVTISTSPIACSDHRMTVCDWTW